jgi:hypothetical protein
LDHQSSLESLLGAIERRLKFYFRKILLCFIYLFQMSELSDSQEHRTKEAGQNNSSSATKEDNENNTTQTEPVITKTESTEDNGSTSSSDEDNFKSYFRGGFFRRREEPEPNVQELWKKVGPN